MVEGLCCGMLVRVLEWGTCRFVVCIGWDISDVWVYAWKLHLEGECLGRLLGFEVRCSGLVV